MDELISFFDAENADEMPAELPPEVEEGNVEYKLKLVNPSHSRFEHLVTQMKWRLQEGEGEAIYEIGVEDSGMLAGLTNAELDASLCTLQRMAAELGATITVLRERHVELEGAECQKRAMEILVRKVPDDQPFLDLRLAVLGNVDAGKSTLIGVLTQGELDNGRGRARLNLFRHLHEIQSGRTSSISHEILGFNDHGEIDTLFSVPGVGSVVGGTIHRGSIKEHDTLQMGPFDDGSFQQVKVKTVHRNRLPCRLVQAGQAATVALCDVPRETLRRGMVLVSKEAPLIACRLFEADVFVLFHSSQIQPGFETTLHVGSVCQTCRIEKICDKV
ncbi:hypothetical protein KUTeg_013205 [Tegillarca granosa]|uniref:Translation elongation factor EFTu-like domain-containing protein n=1 Tax=Tegillarca granosa TaxID=220873 RepID=A0ABQ9ET10_TEGGR|nr:hypothetical protein KUTeg_013205 [Tegillarca granosa]